MNDKHESGFGCVFEDALAERLRTDEAYLIFEDSFFGGYPNAEVTFILFALPLNKLVDGSSKDVVYTNAMKDEEVGAIWKGCAQRAPGKWLPKAGVLEQRWPRKAAFHVKRDGKWFAAGACKTNFEQLVEVLVVSEGLAVDSAQMFANQMWLAAPKLHKLYEHRCNRDLPKGEELREARLEGAVQELATRFGVDLHFNGDPRGAPIKLKLKNGRSNGWGGEWCVSGDRPDLED